MYKITIHTECIYDNDQTRPNVHKTRVILCADLDDVERILNTTAPAAGELLEEEDNKQTDPAEVIQTIQQRHRAKVWTWFVIYGDPGKDEDDDPRQKSIFIDFNIQKYYNRHF